jgi:hypothetical protein
MPEARVIMKRTRWVVLTLAAVLLLGGAYLAANVPLNAGPPPAPQGVGAADIVTLLPIADTYIDSENHSINYGTASILQVQDYLGRDGTQRSLLLFNLSSQVPSNAIITSAYLDLYLESGSGANPITLRFERVASDWQETVVTWNTQPAVETPAISHNVNLVPGYKRFEVTAIVQTWQTSRNYGVEVRESSAAQVFNRTFSSRENANQTPKLVVSYVLPTTTATVTRTPTRTPTPTPTRTPSADLRVIGLEITQAIQDRNNTVPLIAGKRTYVRAHVYSKSGSVSNVTGHFAFGHAQVPATGWIAAGNAGGVITVKASPDRGQREDSFWVEVPPAMLAAGTLYVNFSMNRNHTIPEYTYLNNTMNLSVSLTTSPPVNVYIFNVRYKKDGAWHQASFHDIIMMVSWLRRAYPVASVNWFLRTLNWEGSQTPAQKGCTSVNISLALKRWIEGYPPRWRYYGMVADSGGFMMGCAVGIPSYIASGPTGDPANTKWSWDTDGTYGDWYGAHELGHTYAQRHANFCEAKGGYGYPYPNGWIGGTSGYEYCGWDIALRQVYEGRDWLDIMTYCNNLWISDYTYKAIRNRLVYEAGAAAAAPVVQAGVEYLAVLGSADLALGTAELHTLYRLSDGDDWKLVLQSSRGGTMAEYPFTPKVNEAGPGEGPEPLASILETVPWVDGTARVVILYQGAEVAAQVVSANAPIVDMVYPSGGETLNQDTVMVQWTGHDDDGDPLVYALLYSADAGASWQTVALNVATTQADILLSELPGSNQALFRVIASDGVNTGQGQSDATFQIPLKAPMAFILSPSNLDRFTLEQHVTLVGEGYDAEDGSMPESALAWSSDRQGILGVGTQLSVTDLVEGKHVITLQTKDSDAQTGTASVTIYVGTPPARAYLPILLKS